jgi:chromosome partitioning protein
MPVTIGFVSQKGGTGKSTLARALGAVVAHAGLKVLLADLDARQRTVLEWEKARAANRVAPTLRVRAFRTVKEALEAPEKDELLIIDLAAGGDRRMVDVAKSADLIVQPTSGSLDDLRPAVVLFHDLVRCGIPIERLVFALCRTLSDREEEEARAYVMKAGYEALHGSVPERAAYREAHNRGQSATETAQKALNERAQILMRALFDKVTAQLAQRDRARRQGKS